MLQLVQCLYDHHDTTFYPRPAHSSDLFNMLKRREENDLKVLQHLVRHRQERYRPDSAENPLEYTAMDVEVDAEVPSDDGQRHDMLMFMAGSKIAEEWTLPKVTGESISAFVMTHPASRFDRDTAVPRRFVHWIARFSAHPDEDMTTLATENDLENARLLHSLLARNDRLQCTRR